ncbi:hypothetical protein ACPF8X_38280 [Streptomyces sp. G35A]
MTNPTPPVQVPDSIRVPLDSLHADAEYLLARLLAGTLTREQVAGVIRDRIDAARNAVIEALSGVQALSAAPGGVLDEALRERDDAEDFIDALLDEVLGHERPEWSSSYGRADALNDVQERMTALYKPAVDKAWGRLQSAMAAPKQAAQEPCPTCVSLARTVMLDQVSFDRKPDCYGIRRITDDEGVEEWEDIRTSPDVAREEANDMMATGRGEIYEVVPLYTAPQPAPVAQGDAEDAARMDWLEQQVRQSRTGVSFDYGRSVDGGLVTEKGYRFMKYHLLCDRMPTLRAAIDAARKQGANHDCTTSAAPRQARTLER